MIKKSIIMSKSYLIVGYGGIGQALVQQLHQHDYFTAVISSHQHTGPNITVLDLSNDDCEQQLDDYMAAQTFDVIINTIGVLHSQKHTPEKNLKQLDFDWLQHSFTVNLYPAVRLAKAIAKHYPKKHSLKFINFSARVSSISDNRLGGWYSYRLSKCALNMLIKNVAIEWQRLNTHWLIAGYHPGTVETKLSEPFQAHVAADKLFSPTFAAQQCLNVIEQLQLVDSGQLFDWQGLCVEP